MSTSPNRYPPGYTEAMTRPASNSSDQQPVWLYDGDCGPCEQASTRIADLVDPPVRMAAYQTEDLPALGVSMADVERGPVLVLADRTHLVGPPAMGRLLAMSERPFALVGAVMLAPGVRSVLGAIGPRMYAQRGRLPGAGDACATRAAA